MRGDDGKGGEAAQPELPSLSVGFWDAFAAGLPWTEPVLAVLSCSPVGADYQLILATDGSTTKENKLRKGAQSPTAQASAQQVQEPHATEEAEPQDRPYQHGRLLVQKKTISCRPELLVNRLVSLLVYARCPIKGRLTPVVTDLQLFPGQWTRPKATFVSHPLYAPNPDVKRPRRARGVGRLEDSAADNPSADSVSKGSQKESEDDPGGSPSPAPSPVYNRSRGGPVAKVQRGVRTALADLHLYSHHWEATEIRATFFGRAVSLWYPRLHVGRVYTFGGGVLQRANRVHNPLPHEVEIKFDATAQIEEAEDKPSIPLQRFERVKLADIPNLPPGTIVDLLAFVTEAKEPQTIISRTKNEELVRRELTLLDSSGRSISLALFGAQAMQFSQATQGSRRPCGVPSDQLDAERRWWHLEGQRLSTACAAKSCVALGFQTLKEIALATERLLQEAPGSTQNFRTIASVFDLLGRKFVWLACPTCKRKVQKELPSASTTGAYKCNKCRCAVTPEPRWMLSLKLADFSGTLSCVALGDQGQAVMQVVDTTAEGLSKLEAGGVDTRGRTFANILEQLSFAEFELELIAKCDVYKEDKTVQVTVRGASRVAANGYTQVARNIELIEGLLAAFCPSQAAP